MTTPRPKPARMFAAVSLTETQWRGLCELAAACDEAQRFYGNDCNSVRARYLSGSSRNMRSLMVLGLVERIRLPGYKRSQWTWKLTDKGRCAIAAASIIVTMED